VSVARASVVLLGAACALALGACERESRSFDAPAARARPAAAAQTSVVRYDDNAFALAQGKRLFEWFNCSGCHSQGGGGMGPALMDDVWIYGSEPQTIFQTIVHGRPNGMPSFGKRIPEEQVWQLVAYVRSMSGLAPKSAAPSRNDAMQAKPAENRMPAPSPVRATASGASQR
jgi:cytochrome c oxidase cbb3-type subunit 3